jgi:hypothetical protein
MQFYSSQRIRQLPDPADSLAKLGFGALQMRLYRDFDRLDRDRDFELERERDFDPPARDRAFRRRVAAAFLADAERADFGREAEARPPFFAPLRAGARDVFFPRPEPLFFPPPDILFSVAQARRSASSSGTPRLS